MVATARIAAAAAAADFSNGIHFAFLFTRYRIFL